MTCDDCGKPARKYGLTVMVDGKRRAYCETHGVLRYQLVGERPKDWLRTTSLPIYYTGPLEIKD